MKRLSDVLENVINFRDEDSRPRLGGAARTLGNEQKEFLMSELKTASKHNSVIVAVLVAAHIVLLIGGIAIALSLFRSPNVMQAALGGSFLSLLGILWRLGVVLQNKHKMDLLRAIVPALPPEEVLRVIESMHYGEKNASRRRK